MLKERYHRRCYRHDLVRRDVHIPEILRLDYREVPFKTSLDLFFDELAIRLQGYFRLSYIMSILFFRCEEDNGIFNFYFSIFDFAIRRFDESHLINLCVNTKRGDQTDVRTFRRFNGTETAVVSIVYVADFKACAFTGKTTWT